MLLGSLVESDGLLDLVVLELNKRVLVVAAGVVVGEDSESFGVTATANEPSRRLRAEPHETDLDDGGKALEGRGETP